MLYLFSLFNAGVFQAFVSLENHFSQSVYVQLEIALDQPSKASISFTNTDKNVTVTRNETLIMKTIRPPNHCATLTVTALIYLEARQLLVT